MFSGLKGGNRFNSLTLYLIEKVFTQTIALASALAIVCTDARREEEVYESVNKLRDQLVREELIYYE